MLSIRVKSPQVLAIDAKNRRLFSACSNRLMVVSDPDAGKVVRDGVRSVRVPMGQHSIRNGLRLHLQRRRLRVTIVQQRGATWEVLENVATERGARTIAVDEKTHTIYLPTATAAPSQGGGRPTYLPGYLQGSGGRQMTRRLSVRPAVLPWRFCCALHGLEPRKSRPARHSSSSAPKDRPALLIVITLADALQRAKQNDAQFQASVADVEIAREDRVQAKAGLLPAFSYTTQYLGNQPNGVNPNGRFVSLDGVHMYRAWGVVRGELSANTFTAARCTEPEGARGGGGGKMEVAQRGLVVTVTRAYYALVNAERRYATAQQAVQQAARFLEITQQQERAGQVARSDVVKAEIQSRQQQQSYSEATLIMENARLLLAVLLFPTFNENFTVVDDLRAAPALPSFPEVRGMAGARQS